MSRAGEKIKEARTRRGMTPKALAQKCGVSESFILDVEGGRKIASENLLKRIGKALDLDFYEIPQAEEQPDPVEVKMPVRHSAEREVTQQWELALANILKKIPVLDLVTNDIVDYRSFPVINKKVEGFHPDKLLFVKVPDDTMAGFRLRKGDLVMVWENHEIANQAIALVEYSGKKAIRQLKRLEGNKVLLVSHGQEIKTEMADNNQVKVIGKCIKAEINLN